MPVSEESRCELEHHPQVAQLREFLRGAVAMQVIQGRVVLPESFPAYMRGLLAQMWGDKLDVRPEISVEMLHVIVDTCWQMLRDEVSTESEMPSVDALRWRITQVVSSQFYIHDFVLPINADEAQAVFSEAFSTLGEREQDMLRMRFGIGGKQHTQRQIADVYGFSTTRAAQLVKRAMLQLRHKLYGRMFPTVGNLLMQQQTLLEAARAVQELRAPLPKELLDQPVSKLEFSTRTDRVLRRRNIRFVGKLVEQKPEDLLKEKNFGRKSFREVQEVLEEMGLMLGMDVTGWKPPT